MIVLEFHTKAQVLRALHHGLIDADTAMLLHGMLEAQRLASK